MTSNPSTIEAVPAPWTLKGTIYSFFLYSTSKDAKLVSSEKSFLFSPLEATSSFSDGRFIGGLGSVQVIRYSESPVGPYDELVIIPGNFEHSKAHDGSNASSVSKKRSNLRITRIYVSQVGTCWNGRKSMSHGLSRNTTSLTCLDWNIPKHLAKFEFKELPDNSVSISVYPREQGGSRTPSELHQKPFFAATYKPISYLPRFPSSTEWFKYLGVDLNFVQPPLPEGRKEDVELPGTNRWTMVKSVERSSKTSLGWWDMKRGPLTEEDGILTRNSEDSDLIAGEFENWWPGLGRWRLGMKMEEATIEFPEGKHWAEARI
jgi:hypothetical protein